MKVSVGENLKTFPRASRHASLSAAIVSHEHRGILTSVQSRLAASLKRRLGRPGLRDTLWIHNVLWHNCHMLKHKSTFHQWNSTDVSSTKISAFFIMLLYVFGSIRYSTHCYNYNSMRLSSWGQTISLVRSCFCFEKDMMKLLDLTDLSLCPKVFYLCS